MSFYGLLESYDWPPGMRSYALKGSNVMFGGRRNSPKLEACIPRWPLKSLEVSGLMCEEGERRLSNGATARMEAGFDGGAHTDDNKCRWCGAAGRLAAL